jgi:hypothetical protein
MQGIYKITNKINGHCYVGQSIDIENRFKTHINTVYNKNQTSYKYPIYRAMRKHGIENFEFEVLEIVPQLDDLTSREMYWYKKLDPEYCQIDPVRTVSYVSKAVYMIEPLTLKILNRFNSIREAERYLGTSKTKISDVCNNHHIKALGYHWCFVDNYSEDWKPKETDTRIRVLVINKKTNEEHRYESVHAASKDLNINKQRIYDAIHGVTKKPRDWIFKKI